MPRVERIVSFNGQYRFLSNFYVLDYPVVCSKRLLYLTVENAYQASKSMYGQDRRDIQNLPPAKAKIAGRHVALREDWEEIKIAVMMNFLLQKFVNNHTCRELLLETRTAHLEEGNHYGDRFWGTVNGVGENHLGRLLMSVRTLLGGEG